MAKGKATRRAPPAAEQASVRGLDLALEIGDRVFLRLPTLRDKAEFLRLREESRAFLKRWEPRPPDGSDQFGPGVFDSMMKRRDTDRSRVLLICSAADGAILGRMGIGEIVRGAFQSCYLGYWIGRRYAGQGYMSEALQLTLRHAFHTLRLHRVEANIMPHNTASVALAKRSGFRFEGAARRYLQIQGRWRDHEHWAMTVEDWARSPRRARGTRRTPAKARGR